MRCVDVTVRTQILTRAREIVATGWMQGDIGDGDHACLIGALSNAGYENGFSYFMVQPWRVMCGDLELPDADTLVEFNDLATTTQEDVIFLLDEWIESARVREPVREPVLA